MSICLSLKVGHRCFVGRSILFNLQTTSRLTCSNNIFAYDLGEKKALGMKGFARAEGLVCCLREERGDIIT